MHPQRSGSTPVNEAKPRKVTLTILYSLNGCGMHIKPGNQRQHSWLVGLMNARSESGIHMNIV